MTVPEHRPSLEATDTEKKSVDDEKPRKWSSEFDDATPLHKLDDSAVQNNPDEETIRGSVKDEPVTTIENASDSAHELNGQLDDIENPISKRQRRKQALLKALYIIVFNAALPIGLYYALKPHIPAVWALVASTAPTIISVIAQAIVARRLDMIGVAVIFGKSAGYDTLVLSLIVTPWSCP